MRGVVSALSTSPSQQQRHSVSLVLLASIRVLRGIDFPHSSPQIVGGI